MCAKDHRLFCLNYPQINMVGEERLCDKPKEHLRRRLHVVLSECISSEWMGTDVFWVFLLFTFFCFNGLQL